MFLDFFYKSFFVFDKFLRVLVFLTHVEKKGIFEEKSG